MATPLSGYFETPQKTSRAATLGAVLGGFGAGMQGRGQEHAMAVQQQQQTLELNRQKAMAQDAMRVYGLLNQGSYDDALSLIDARVKAINELGGDPSDTLEIRQLITAGRIPEAAQELETFLGQAVQYGLIEPPKAPELVETTPQGQAIMRLPNGQVVASDVQGFRQPAPEPQVPMTDIGKLRADLQAGRITTDDFQAEVNRMRQSGQSTAAPSTDIGKLNRDLNAGDITPEQYNQELDAMIQQRETQMAASQAEAAEAENRDQMVLMEAQRIYDLTNKLMANESGLAGAIGPVSSLLPSFRQETVDFEADLAELQSLLTMSNLGRMTGVLSESDIKLIREAASGISTRGSEGRMREKLAEIQQRILPKLIEAGILDGSGNPVQGGQATAGEMVINGFTVRQVN